MAHCRREVMHAQWKILLDDEFLEAYEHGVVIKCCDGIKRRFYPRILTYSADYPEKYVFSCSFLCKAYSDCVVAEFFSPVSVIKDIVLALDVLSLSRASKTWGCHLT
jgi:hypothetical protein